MTNQAFNKWCAEKAGHQNACPAIYDDESDQVLYDYQECACDYATDLVAMLRVVDILAKDKENPWDFNLCINCGNIWWLCEMNTYKKEPYRFAEGEANTPEAALKSALVEVMGNEQGQ